MDSTQAKSRIDELRKTLEYHAKKYYDEDKWTCISFKYSRCCKKLWFNISTWKYNCGKIIKGDKDEKSRQ